MLFSRLALWIALAAAPGASAAPAAAGHWLEAAVESWLGERDHWAFTQRAVEYDQGRPRERLERYDPSQPGESRWTLLAIDGRTPTSEERADWARKKFKKNRRRFDTPIGDYFDFRDARVIGETAQVIRFDVPLRRDKNWLFQTDKVNVVVTVSKETKALVHLTAQLREPLKVLLGLARITDGKLDLSFLNFEPDGAPGPASSQPTGTAHVTVSRFGERAEFTWSDFKRVGPAPALTRADPR